MPLSNTVGNEAYVAYRINLNFMQRTLGLVGLKKFCNSQYIFDAHETIFS